MPVEKCADAEPIRGYRLVERLGAGGFGEVWKCEAPGGIFKAAKFVYGSVNGLSNDSVHAEEELRAFQLIKSIRHPFLLSIDRVEVVADELVIITELADQNLHEVLEKYLAHGQPGIPRDEVLGYLQEAAEVLDLLNQKFNLQHLDIKPRNLFLVSNHVKVADFGLVNSLSDSVTTKLNAALNAVTPLYAAPELFKGHISPHCDQYSLAIAFQELMTGSLPFQGKNFRQLLMQHTQENPDLQRLSAHDRVIVGRALSKDPHHRYESCMDFVRALRADSSGDLMPASEPYVLSADAMPAETVFARMDDTARLQAAAAPVMPAGVLSDHRFVERWTNSSLMEVWKTQLPDGAKKRVQILFGLGTLGMDKLKEALSRLQSIHHPALLSPSVAHGEPGRLILLADPVRETLRTRAHHCQARKQPGIPRAELVEYIRAAAEVLDYLYQQHSVQHLNLNPRSLVLDNGWLQIDEFGYAQVLWYAAGQDIGQRNMRYAAPELFSSTLSRHCDQYSLALIFAEMLTGVHPFHGLAPQSYLAKKMDPDLAQLSDVDRAVIQQALNADPNQRWSNCTEMLLALEGSSLDQSKESQKSDHFGLMVAAERNDQKKSIYTGADPEQFNETIAKLIQAAGGHIEPTLMATPELAEAGDALRYHFVAGLPLGAAQEQISLFCKQTGARVASLTEACCVLHVELSSNLLQRWLRRTPTLEVRVHMARVNAMSSTPIEIKLELSALHCPKRLAVDLMATKGIEIINGLQQRLLVNSEKRTKERLLWPHPIKIIPLNALGEPEEAIECRGKDLSATGMGIYLPHELATAEILIELPNMPDAPLKIPATLVRAKRCADGWYDVGALFRLPVNRRTLAEVCV